MSNYRFKIIGKINLGKIDLNRDKNNKNDNMKIFDREISLKKVSEYRFEIIWWAIFTLIFILGLVSPIGNLLEFLYLFHKKAIYSIIIFLVVWETIHLIQGLIKKESTWDLIKHFIKSLMIFIILLMVNLWLYEKIIGPKLTTIKIVEPKENTNISMPITEVKVFVRNVKLPIYIIVEDPQGTHWIQSKRYIPHNQFKDILSQEVRLGQGYIGIGEKFRILALGTEKKLEIGILEIVPPDSILSNVVTVKRIK